MEWTQFQQGLQTIGAWTIENIDIVLLSLFVLAQWIALQALAIHYYYFRKNLKQPRPDAQRLQKLEQLMDFSSGQFDLVFHKLGELRKEMSKWAATDVRNGTQTKMNASMSDQNSVSLESSMLSMGEINLKKRIDAIRSHQ